MSPIRFKASDTKHILALGLNGDKYTRVKGQAKAIGVRLMDAQVGH